MPGPLGKRLHDRLRGRLTALRSAALRLRGEAVVEVLGHRVVVPPGVFHPATDGSTDFFFRAVGPMVAPGHRVLDLGTGCGLGALVAASRGAEVVAVDRSRAAIEAARRNVEAAGLGDRVELRCGDPVEVVGDERFDLVWWNAPLVPEDGDPARTSGRGHREVGRVIEALPRWLGERGRLVITTDERGTLRDFVPAHLPRGYRCVELARSLPIGSSYLALSVGWDLEAARARRHEERELTRTRDQRASVSRRRWDGRGRTPKEPGGREAGGV